MNCYKCGAELPAGSINRVNVNENPELKEQIVSGELFLQRCPSCGEVNLGKWPLLYHDPSQNLIIWLSDGNMAVERSMREVFVQNPEMSQYTGRIVDTVGELVEKIKIFDAGLDDIALELCKYITCADLKKDVQMKFFKADGADNEITLAYPEEGRMQMIEIGFSVYEECAAILRRNPDMLSKANGLVRINESYISGILA